MGKLPKLGRFGLEFVSVFLAVVLAFMLSNWNDGRKAELAQEKILKEILAGLDQDARDVESNVQGHEAAMKCNDLWMDYLNGTEVPMDTLGMVYSYAIFRDYISLQNTTGYEALKSRGLELVESDSLRTDIVGLYEYDYELIKLFEEEYEEMQYFRNYYPRFEAIVMPHLLLSDRGRTVGLDPDAEFTEMEKREMKVLLDRMSFNREFILVFYGDVRKKIAKLQGDIRVYLEER
jgi:hypothetical protein